MIYLCCDTNIWINISNSEEPTRLLDTLHTEISNGNIILILPEVIEKEWERNKILKIINVINKNIDEQKRILHKLSDFLNQEYKSDFDEFTQDIETKDIENKAIELKASIEKYKSKIIDKANANIKKVEEIFNHSSTIKLFTDEKTSLKVIKIFTDKSFPFEDKRNNKIKNEVEEKNKNNFADCLLFYQFINFLEAYKIKGAHFVTSNKKDFYPNDKLHTVYLSEINKVNAEFHKSLSEAMNKSLNKELVSLNELKRIQYIANQRNNDYTCTRCDISDDDDESEMAIYFNTILDFKEIVNIIDERIEFFDKKQTELFENDFLSVNPNRAYNQKLLEIAMCGNCSAEHFLCPECKGVICIDDIKFNEIQQCEHCTQSFMYKQDIDKKGSVHYSEFIILKENNECAKCGDDFTSRGDNSSLCIECEDYYGTDN